MDKEIQKKLREAIQTMLPYHQTRIAGMVLVDVIRGPEKSLGGGLVQAAPSSVVITISGLRSEHPQVFHAIHEHAVDIAMQAGATSVTVAFV